MIVGYQPELKGKIVKNGENMGKRQRCPELLPAALLDDGKGKSNITEGIETSDMSVSSDDSKGNTGEAREYKQGADLMERPTLEATGQGITGNMVKKLRLQNKKRRLAQLDKQRPYSQWEQHRGTVYVGEGPRPVQADQLEGKRMFPQGRAASHLAGTLLEEWATYGCPTNTGKEWTVAEMEAAIRRGPHKSAREPEAIEHFKQEIERKVKDGQARVVTWNSIKDNPPAQLKISPVAAIPHKSKAYRSILDLSFPLRLDDGTIRLSVNDTTLKTAPQGAIDQIGHSLKRINGSLV